MKDMRVLECDCLVIGSGPGGAITAAVLAQAGRDVLVVEEGRDESGSFGTFSLAEMDRYRHGGVSVSRGDPRVFYLEGCCLGGASEINGALYHRPLQPMLDEWERQYKIRSFGGGALDAFFDMNEKDLGVGAAPAVLGPGSRVLERGAQALAWKAAATARMWDHSGIDPRGQRFSMTRSFIPRARAAGARFITGTKVTRIRSRAGRAYEAQGISSDGKIMTRLRFKTVFICAGAVQTPHLLQRSGWARHIGQRLKVHLSARLVAEFEDTSSDPLEGVPVMQVSEFKPALTLGCSFTSPAFLASWLAGHRDLSRIVRDPSKFGIFYASIIAQAKGKVGTDLLSGDAALTMQVPDEDLGSLGDGLYKLGRLLFAAGARTVYSPAIEREDFRCPTDMEGLRKDILGRGAELSTMHLFASCPMGEDLSRCAVDSFGRVHGTGNVHINDASMLPDAPGTNPQSLIMALARRNAMHWLEHGAASGGYS